MRRDVGRVRAVARVGDEIAAEAEITFALLDPDRFAPAPLSPSSTLHPQP